MNERLTYFCQAGVERYHAISRSCLCIGFDKRFLKSAAPLFLNLLTTGTHATSAALKKIHHNQTFNNNPSILVSWSMGRAVGLRPPLQQKRQESDVSVCNGIKKFHDPGYLKKKNPHQIIHFISVRWCSMYLLKMFLKHLKLLLSGMDVIFFLAFLSENYLRQDSVEMWFLPLRMVMAI